MRRRETRRRTERDHGRQRVGRTAAGTRETKSLMLDFSSSEVRWIFQVITPAFAITACSTAFGSAAIPDCLPMVGPNLISERASKGVNSGSGARSARHVGVTAGIGEMREVEEVREVTS